MHLNKYLRDQIKNQMRGARGMYGRQETYVQCFGWRPVGMKPLQRSWYRRDDNSKMDLQEVGWGGMDWMNLVQDTDRWLAFVKCGNEHAGITN